MHYTVGDELHVRAQRPVETGPAVKLKLRVNADTSTRVEVWCRMPLAATFADLLHALAERYRWEQAAAAASIKLEFDGQTLAATATPPQIYMEDEDLVDMTVPTQLLSKGSTITTNDEVNVYSSAAAAAVAPAAPLRPAAAAKKAAPKKPAAAAASKGGSSSSTSSSRPAARRRPGAAAAAAAAAKQNDVVCIDSDDDEVTAVAGSSSSTAAPPAATPARRGRPSRAAAAAAASSSASTATSGGASPAGRLSPLPAPVRRSELRLLLALTDRAESEPPCPVSVYNDATFRKFVTRFLKAKAVKGTPELSCKGAALSLDSTPAAAGLAPNDTITITVTRPSAALDLQWVDQVYRYELLVYTVYDNAAVFVCMRWYYAACAVRWLAMV
jgi:Ubiquitin-2 like Rad60 SUMO-like